MKKNKKNTLKKSNFKILGIAACLAVIGTAAAAWQFNKSATANKDFELSVQGYDTIGSIQITDAGEECTLKLDSSGVEFINGDISADYTGGADAINEVESEAITRTYTIKLSDNLAEYVKFVDTTQAEGTWTDGEAITLPEMAWVDGKNPKSLTKYNEMKNALTGATVNIEFRADVAGV